ncbi:MAG: VWA domain-containing protein [Acidobacteriota bacterium]|nr:VWA domain-containing protein [Acidobacteriota bacterium]
MTIRARFPQNIMLSMIAMCLCGSTLFAQQLPPVQPAAPYPDPAQVTETLRVTTNEVLVPTLVEKKNGDIIYGLRQKDFILEDNGAPQKIRVQEEMDTAPVALVIAVQEGGASALEFDKVSKLGPLLDMFMTDRRSEAALVGFAKQPYLLQDFTQSKEELGKDLQELQPGGGGAAILDTVSYAVDLLETQPKNYRRVLLLISEERDHGSKHTRPEELVQKIGRSDVLVLSVAFSPSRAEFTHDLTDNGDNRTLNMVNSLAMIVKAFKKNVAKQIALMSGGEYTTFTNGERFQMRVLDAAKHMRNRYLITFSPSNPIPGLHTIRVRTVEDYGARIVARDNYWLQAGH